MRERYVVRVLMCLAILSSQLVMAGETPFRVERLLDRPIITPATHPSIGENIQGPSLVRVPDWVEVPLGRYYLYFADHKGRYIRLAFADELTGPWTVHPPGSLQLTESYFSTEAPEGTPEQLEAGAARRAKAEGIGLEGLGHDLVKESSWPHIASPDVHIDHDNERFVIYFHGLESFGRQVTRAATSKDGISFVADPEILGRTYWRAFRHDGYHYALAMPGQIYRSRDAPPRLRGRAAALQSRHAPRRASEARQPPVRFLHASGAHAGAYSLELDRAERRLDELARIDTCRDLASRARLGRCRCAARPFRQKRRLRTRQPAAGPR